MTIHAYYEDYLYRAQGILGDMMDFAVNTCDLDPDDFFQKFIVAGVANQFGSGNPKYLAGMTGCEIVKEVMQKCGQPVDDIQDEMYLDKSPEYWAGWALCYYQWYSGRSFHKIYQAISMQEIIWMYDVFHEMDIQQFVDAMNQKYDAFYPETNLKRIRRNAKMSQSELAEDAGVSIRQIQLFEQRQRDINKTNAITVVKLAKALGCEMEMLLEI